MERRVEADASVNLAQAQKTRTRCEAELEACQELLRQENERHNCRMELLNKKLSACKENLKMADKYVDDAEAEFNIASRFSKEMSKQRRLCSEPAAGSSVSAISGARITPIEDGTADAKSDVPSV